MKADLIDHHILSSGSTGLTTIGKGYPRYWSRQNGVISKLSSIVPISSLTSNFNEDIHFPALARVTCRAKSWVAYVSLLSLHTRHWKGRSGWKVCLPSTLQLQPFHVIPDLFSSTSQVFEMESRQDYTRCGPIAAWRRQTLAAILLLLFNSYSILHQHAFEQRLSRLAITLARGILRPKVFMALNKLRPPTGFSIPLLRPLFLYSFRRLI
jgi:hypothetical protein